MAEHDTVWTAVSALLRAQVSEAVWLSTFQDVVPLPSADTSLRLEVPNGHVRERILTRYLQLVLDALAEIDESERQLIVEVAPIDHSAEIDLPDVDFDAELVRLTSGSTPDAPDAPRATATKTETRGLATGLNPRYTFDTFVKGASNQFALAAAHRVAETPARSYNPLFIYGPAGLGKTHLLHAIGNYVRDVHHLPRVRYVSTETLMNEFVDSIRTNTSNTFRRRYREVDVLLIDDIQFLERTEQLQEEFFHTFNDLHGRGSQIVISSDRPPKLMATLEDRLRSRFEWGLITDIQPPEFESRLAILRKKAESLELDGIPDEVLAFIADNVVDNVRELEGSLIRVAAYSSLHRTRLDEEMAREILADLLPAARPRIITPQLILDETAKMFGWTVDELIGKSRRRPLVKIGRAHV